MRKPTSKEYRRQINNKKRLRSNLKEQKKIYLNPILSIRYIIGMYMKYALTCEYVLNIV